MSERHLNAGPPIILSHGRSWNATIIAVNDDLSELKEIGMVVVIVEHGVAMIVPRHKGYEVGKKVVIRNIGFKKVSDTGFHRLLFPVLVNK